MRSAGFPKFPLNQVGPGDRCSFGGWPSPNKYLPRIGPVSSSGTESQRTVEFSNSSIIIGFFISRIALEPGHTFLPEFQQQTAPIRGRRNKEGNRLTRPTGTSTFSLLYVTCLETCKFVSRGNN